MKKLFAIVLLAIVVGNASGQVQIQKVEASFIANFVRYIKWPQQESMKTFTIGVLGKNQAIYKELNSRVSGKNVGLAKIAVVEVNEADDLKKCQIVFIPNGRSSKAKKIISGLENLSIMLITEEQDFTPNFSVINFKVKDSKLTFQLNSEIAKQKKIQVSAKLAQMASK